MVDSGRDKVIVHANVAVPLFGNINADVLYNFNTGQSVSYIPFLGICQPAPGNTTLNLTDILSRAFDPSANLTTFKGLESAPWDQTTPLWKFETTINSWDEAANETVMYRIDHYFESSTGNMKWSYYINGGYTVQFAAGGMQPATFQDSDFAITQCQMKRRKFLS